MMNRNLAARYGEQADSQALGRIASQLRELAEECATLGFDIGLPPVLTPSRDSAASRRAHDLAQRTHHYLAARRARSSVLDGDWFADPVWDVLLDLFAAQCVGRRVSISSACIAANVPVSTALRWIDKLVHEEALVREGDPEDRRRSYLALAPEVAERLGRWVEDHLPVPDRLNHLPAS